MTDEAAKKRMEESKKALEQQNEKRAKEAEERAKKRGRPTPTQMENDLAALGHHPELEPDGSGPDPHDQRALQAEHAGGYQTRAMAAAPKSPAPAR
jgi:hypothetical protein